MDMSAAAWAEELPHAQMNLQELALLGRIKEDAQEHLAARMPRYEHSLGVARVAEGMACLYGQDPFLAAAAGVLHDWEKAENVAANIAYARELGIAFDVDLELVGPLLHGIVAAQVLPKRYPELDGRVWQAIARHTTGAADASDLDKIVYIADMIEPHRKSAAPIVALREGVGARSLDELYLEAVASTCAFVLQTKRYLYPGSVDIYNTFVARRNGKDCA